MHHQLILVLSLISYNYQKNFIVFTIFITSLVFLFLLNINSIDEEIDSVQIKESNEQFLNQLINGKSNELTLPLYLNRKINYKTNQINLKIFDNCCYDLTYEYTGGKPGGFIDEIFGKLIFITGDGRFFSIDVRENFSNANELIRTEMSSNITDVIEDINLFSKSRISIRGIKAYEDKVFFSYIDEVSENCFTLSVAKGEFDFNLNNVHISSFYKPNQCLQTEGDVELNLGSQEECLKDVDCLKAERGFNLHSSGGQIEFYKDNLIIAVGEFGITPEAQNDNNIFGKIISIDLDNKEIKLVSKGHRNIQGMALKDDLLYTTEHGPVGGDEVNLINLNEKYEVLNYGWPVASYGSIIENKYKEEAPAYNSHEKYNFVEPINYFNPSIGISSLNITSKNSLLISSLKANKIFVINKNHKQKIFGGNNLRSVGINLGDRIRDIHYSKTYNLYYIVFETRPSLGIMSLDN